MNNISIRVFPSAASLREGWVWRKVDSVSYLVENLENKLLQEKLDAGEVFQDCFGDARMEAELAIGAWLRSMSTVLNLELYDQE